MAVKIRQLDHPYLVPPHWRPSSRQDRAGTNRAVPSKSKLLILSMNFSLMAGCGLLPSNDSRMTKKAMPVMGSWM